MTRASTAVAGVIGVLSAGFAVVHVAWALGWRGGVPADVAPIGSRPVFLTYDLVATAWLVPATLVGSVAALLRGVPALAIDVVSGDLGGAVGPLADLWFVVVGALGLLLWRGARADVRRHPRRAAPS